VTKAHPLRSAAQDDVASPWLQRMATNLMRWCLVLLRPPQGRQAPPPWLTARSVGTIVLLLAAIVASMFFLDTAASAWARQLPPWFRAVFEEITKFGLSGWFLYPLGFLLLLLAAVISPALPRSARGMLAALAARFGFLFLAIGAPSLFTTIVKRLIGRARPFVGGYDNPFLYKPVIWRPEYASMPSGHSTTAAAVAMAIGAVWPRARPAMWLYALLIMSSRVIVLAHHPSDVLAGALVGGLGALMMRRAFAAQRLVFYADDLRPYPWPSWRRLKAAIMQVNLRLGRGPRTPNR
jgi:membrane-associated phospholipid phosphatase